MARQRKREIPVEIDKLFDGYDRLTMRDSLVASRRCAAEIGSNSWPSSKTDRAKYLKVTLDGVLSRMEIVDANAVHA